jgi:hypothetical protein
MSGQTLIHETRIRTKNREKINISDDFNEKMRERYNSDIIFKSRKHGLILFNEKENYEYFQQNIRTDMRANEIAEIILDIAKEYNQILIGSFNFTTCYMNGDNQGTVFFFEDKVIIRSFEVDDERYSERHARGPAFTETITKIPLRS